MTQLDVLWPLLLWQRHHPSPQAETLIDRLRATLPLFDRPQWDYVCNNFPPRDGDSFMDTWYFLENALIKLPWVAHLTGDETLRAMFFRALRGARQLARHTGYLFPLFADASDWRPRASLLNAGVGGLYAAGCAIAHQLDGGAGDWLDEAAQALRALHQLPPHQLTHEPQQLSFAAASAAYLHRQGLTLPWTGRGMPGTSSGWRCGWPIEPRPRGALLRSARHVSGVRLVVLPGIQGECRGVDRVAGAASLGHWPAALMAAVANLQRCHNYAFFDPFLPAESARPMRPYPTKTSLPPSSRTRRSWAGIVRHRRGLWSALLFDRLGSADPPDVLCLCLDVPCVELRPIPPARRFLVYNPAQEARPVTLTTPSGQMTVGVPARAVQIVEGPPTGL